MFNDMAKAIVTLVGGVGIPVARWWRQRQMDNWNESTFDRSETDRQKNLIDWFNSLPTVHRHYIDERYRKCEQTFKCNPGGFPEFDLIEHHILEPLGDPRGSILVEAQFRIADCIWSELQNRASSKNSSRASRKRH